MKHTRYKMFYCLSHSAFGCFFTSICTNAMTMSSHSLLLVSDHLVTVFIFCWYDFGISHAFGVLALYSIHSYTVVLFAFVVSFMSLCVLLFCIVSILRLHSFRCLFIYKKVAFQCLF